MKNWRNKLPKKRYQQVICVFVAVLLITLGILMIPNVQKKIILAQAEKHTESFSVEYVHLLPWSVEIRGLDISLPAAVAKVERFKTSFCVTKLFWHIVQVNELTVSGAHVQIRESDQAPSEGAFPGVFALIDQGFRLTLEQVAVDATVILVDGTLIDLSIPQGQFDASGRGELLLAVDVSQGDKLHASTSGMIAISQSKEGGIEEIFSELSLSASMAQSADSASESKPFELDIDAVLTPWTDTRVVDGETSPQRYFIGDVLDVNLSLPKRENKGVDLASSIKFNGLKNLVTGNYDLRVAPDWIEAMIGNDSAPLMAEQGKGEFSFDLSDMNLKLEYTGDTSFTTLERLLNDNPSLPDSLRLNKSLKISSDTLNVTIESFETGLGNTEGDSLFTLGLSDPIAIVIADPEAALGENKTIAKFELAQIPIEWVGGFVPEATLQDGQLSGSFVLETNEGVVRLLPVEPLQLSATKIFAQELPEQLVSVSMEPHVYYTAELLKADISKLSVVIAGDEAVRLDVAMNLPFAEDNPPMAVTSTGKLALDKIKRLSAVAPLLEQYPVPDGLSADFDAKLLVHPESLEIQTVLFNLKRNKNSLIKLTGLQPFQVGFAEEIALDYKSGALARVEINDIDLKWANPYLGELKVDGALADARLQLVSAANSGFVVNSTQPLSIRKLDVSKNGDPLVKDLRIDINPSIELKSNQLTFAYEDLAIGTRGKNIISGNGSLVMPRTGKEIAVDKINIDGRSRVNINELANLPAMSALVDQKLGTTDWGVVLNYDVNYSAKEIILQKFVAEVRANKLERVKIKSNGVTRLRAKIGAKEPLAQHVIGDMSVAINGITADEIKDLVPLGGFDFKTIDGEFLLSSNGSTLSAIFSKVFALSGASLKSKSGPLVNEFDFFVSGKLDTSGSNLDASLSDIQLNFASDKSKPAVGGDVTFRITPDRAIPIETLVAELNGDLPILLKQPAIMPGHSLASGGYNLNANVNPAGEISGNAKLGGLAATKPLAVNEFSAEINGKMAASGKGFAFDMPIKGTGKTGETVGVLSAEFAPNEGEATRLSLDFNSEQFFLNDLLAAVTAIGAKNKPQTQSKNKKKTKDKDKEKDPQIAQAKKEKQVALDEVADKKAFWDVLPLDSVLSYDIKKLYYTDYVIFNDVSGKILIQPTQLDIKKLTAHFHESPMKFNGAFKFIRKTPSPYDVKLTGSIREFNLNQIFSELVPGVKPRVEGLFGVSIDVFGTSPNMGQFRNNLFFDNRLQSREGLFRPLPPDSGLLVGASDVLGFVGEGLSYMPTGGFGAGALSRLVNYIKEIDYDLIDIHLTRGDSRDIVIEEFLVKSPTVRLEASGGIDYEYGKDVLDSPLSLDAQLNMSGKGAAILYSMDLLESEQDGYGYNHGPKFEIRGTPNAPHSNFAEIVSAGAKGTVAGGITRPISGLIGNIKHRWFGGDTKPADTDSLLGEPSEAKPAQPIEQDQQEVKKEQ